VAALALLGRLEELDVSRLVEWLSQRQTEFGGYNGRTNKLIDSCYSFWVGGIFNILNNYYSGKVAHDGHLLYLEADLQRYILFYCQDLKKGGLWDKPGKNRDIYHTCYALSGLSASQQLGSCLNGVKL
jgi:protein farnesyltransferase subunit beta